jgi:hypothetical protein
MESAGKPIRFIFVLLGIFAYKKNTVWANIDARRDMSQPDMRGAPRLPLREVHDSIVRTPIS